MPANRSQDCWTQARHDRDAARRNAEMAIHDWACFMAQQAAEKALTALIEHHGGDAWGHSVRELAELLPAEVVMPDDVRDTLPLLDRFYIPMRYPNGIDSGAPADTFGTSDAETVISLREAVLRFVEGHLSQVEHF